MGWTNDKISKGFFWTKLEVDKIKELQKRYKEEEPNIKADKPLNAQTELYEKNPDLYQQELRNGTQGITSQGFMARDRARYDKEILKNKHMLREDLFEEFTDYLNNKDKIAESYYWKTLINCINNTKTLTTDPKIIARLDKLTNVIENTKNTNETTRTDHWKQIINYINTTKTLTTDPNFIYELEDMIYYIDNIRHQTIFDLENLSNAQVTYLEKELFPDQMMSPGNLQDASIKDNYTQDGFYLQDDVEMSPLPMSLWNKLEEKAEKLNLTMTAYLERLQKEAETEEKSLTDYVSEELKKP